MAGSNRSRVARLARFDAIVLTSALWFLGKFVRFAFPPLFERLAEVYGVSTGVLGGAYSGLLLVYALLQFPSGLLADRYNSVTVLGAGAALAAVGALALSVDAPLIVLVSAMLTIGAGTGTLKTVGVELLSRTYPTQTGRALGVFDTFGTFGGAAAPVAVVTFAGTAGLLGAGWRTTFLVAGVAGLSVTAAFVLRVPDRLSDATGDGAAEDRATDEGETDEEATEAGATDDGTIDDGATEAGGVPLAEYAALFRDWRLLVFVAVITLFSFAYNAALAFLPLYLTREAGLASATASFLFSALFVVSLVQLLTGEVSDRTGALPLIVLTLAIASAGLGAIVLLSGVGGTLALGAAVVCLGLGAHGYRPVRGAYMMSVLPDSVTAGSFGAVRTVQMLAGASSPALVGVLSETAGLRPAFWLLTVTLVAATALSVVLWAFD